MGVLVPAGTMLLGGREGEAVALGQQLVHLQARGRDENNVALRRARPEEAQDLLAVALAPADEELEARRSKM